MLFRVGSDSKLDLGDQSVDLLTSCQAAHWFDDLAAFYAEADRVLRPGGAIAVYGYHFTDPVAARGAGQEEQERVERFLDHRLGSYSECRFYHVSLASGKSLKVPSALGSQGYQLISRRVLPKMIHNFRILRQIEKIGRLVL